MIWGHKTPEVGGVETSAEVIKAGLGVAFFAGEVHGTGIGAGAGEPVAERQTGAGFVGRAGIGDVFRAEPVNEVGGSRRAAAIGGEVPVIGVDFAAIPSACGTEFGDDVACAVT